MLLRGLSVNNDSPALVLDGLHVTLVGRFTDNARAKADVESLSDTLVLGKSVYVVNCLGDATN